MKYLFEIASRTTLDQSVEKKHKTLIEGLKQVPDPWGVADKSKDYDVSAFGNQLISVFKLNKILGKNIKGEIIYRYRRLLADDSSNDDHIHIEFDPSKIKYIELIDVVLKQYVSSFDAYSASIFNEDLIFEDFEKSRNKNFRDTILRFYPVCFFDEELSLRALKLAPQEVITRLTGQVEKVEIFRGGVVIIATNHLMSREQANDFDLKIASLLGVPR